MIPINPGIMNISLLCELGYNQILEKKITRAIRIKRITSNAFEMNGCFYISQGDEWIDLFVMNGLAWREFEPGWGAYAPGDILKVHYNGVVPRGWLAATEFRLTLTLEILS
jgi:hypothetical protein